MGMQPKIIQATPGTSGSVWFVFGQSDLADPDSHGRTPATSAYDVKMREMAVSVNKVPHPF